jgi:protein-L-isoaspartate(D-aspartate) O-methyltransferase
MRCASFGLRILLCAAVLSGGGAVAGADPPAARAALIEEVRQLRWQLGRELGPGGFDGRVLAALGRVPREEFVPDAVKARAYENRPLPIGSGQTISQPFIVALMTDLLQLKPGDRVLEIGTGSGYQTAVLAELVERVFTIEIDPALGRRAAATLARLGYAGVTARVADGYQGWPEHAPFDAILVTAAPTSIPPPLLAQLKPGGRLVVPVGEAFATQSLQLVTKQPGGRITTREILPVAFVPLTGTR